MKTFPLFLAAFLLLTGLAFAQNTANTAPAAPQDANTTKGSVYKSSPRLSYHTHETEDEKTMEKLKPMLNQLGNSANGGMMPTGPSMSF